MTGHFGPVTRFSSILFNTYIRSTIVWLQCSKTRTISSCTSTRTTFLRWKDDIIFYIKSSCPNLYRLTIIGRSKNARCASVNFTLSSQKLVNNSTHKHCWRSWKGPRSFTSLRTYDVAEHEIVKATCVTQRFIESDERWQQCLRDVSGCKVARDNAFCCHHPDPRAFREYATAMKRDLQPFVRRPCPLTSLT